MGIKVNTPVTYCIRVQGFLPSSMSDRLGGMTIVNEGQDAPPVVTILSGQLVDQAALFGVLMALYDMRLPLISVECLEADCNN
jgi:hypothetical protein